MPYFVPFKKSIIEQVEERKDRREGKVRESNKTTVKKIPRIRRGSIRRSN